MTNNYSRESGYTIPNMGKFTEQEDSYFDYRKYVRVLSGRITKERYKAISSYCRKFSRTPIYRCGHEHDCCGCLCGQQMSFTNSQHAIIITLVHRYNY